MKKFKVKIYVLIAGIAVVGGFAYMKSAAPANGTYDAFAQCIKDSGAMFYGAFWCPHCQTQKAMFGASAQLLPYTECSLPNASGQTAVCIANGIQSYPTWVFNDASRLTGEISFATLSEKTGCALPQ